LKPIKLNSQTLLNGTKKIKIDLDQIFQFDKTSSLKELDSHDNLTPKGYFSLFLSSNHRVRWVELFFKKVQPIFHIKNNNSIL